MAYRYEGTDAKASGETISMMEEIVSFSIYIIEGKEQEMLNMTTEQVYELIEFILKNREKEKS